MKPYFINQWRTQRELSFIAVEVKNEPEGVYVVLVLLGVGVVIFIRR